MLFGVGVSVADTLPCASFVGLTSSTVCAYIGVVTSFIGMTI